MSESTRKLVKQMQDISYKILCDIDEFCKKNKLTYFLSGGTCLGAIRNKGIIPWDDDIDIMLPRKDYEKLLRNFGQTYQGKYKLGYFYTDDNWDKPYAKIWDVNTRIGYKKLREVEIGVFIDVFPIDGVPTNPVRRKFFFIQLRVLNVLRNAANRTEFYDYEKYKNIKKFLGLFAKHFGSRFFALRMNKVAMKYPFDSSKYVGVSLAAHYWEKETIKKKCMSSAIWVPFESGKFPVPIGYNQYLMNLYGNYMIIPKDAEEKGYTHLDAWNVNIK